MQEQRNFCETCAETLTFRGVVRRLAVDHCHQSGKIRGLLCADCNRALGMFKDNAQALRRAADYIEERN